MSLTSQIASLCKQLLSQLKDLCAQGEQGQVVPPAAGLANLLQVTQKIRIFIQLSPINPNDAAAKKSLLDSVEKLGTLVNEISPDLHILFDSPTNRSALENVDALRKDFLSTVTTLVGFSKGITLDTVPDPALTMQNFDKVCLKSVHNFYKLIVTKDPLWKNQTR